MAVSYKKLWHVLLDKDLMKKDLEKLAGVSHYTVTQLGKNKDVSTEALVKICTALNCDLMDIMELVPENEKNEQNGEMRL